MARSDILSSKYHGHSEMKYPFSGLIVRYVKVATPTGPSDPQPKDELHVNLWEMSGRKFVDIGVMLNRPQDVEALQVDLPWQSDRTKVFDLGSRLVGERIVAAIFNEVVRYNGSNDQTFAEVTFPLANATPGFLLARLSSDVFETEQIILSDGSLTTRLRVTIPTLSSNQRLYIRFRIIDVPELNYTAIFYQRDRNLLSSSLETRIVDFRINVRRGIPDDVLTSQTNLEFPRWKKIHFFLTLDRTREMTFDSENFVACRSLEDEAIWNNYIFLNGSGVASDCSVSDYLGYQWTSKASSHEAPAKDLVALARFSQVNSSTSYIVRFVILALIIGAAGNGLWNLIEEELAPHLVEKPRNTLFTLACLVVLFIAAFGLTTVTVRRGARRVGALLRQPALRLRRFFSEEG